MVSSVDVMEKLLSHINRLSKQSVVCGDFNVHFHSNDNKSLNLINIFCMYGLEIEITEMTIF